MCLCLTLERLSDNPDFTNWTVSQGRLETFQSIKNIVAPVLEQENESTVSKSAFSNGRGLDSGGANRGLLSMLAMALAYQAQIQARDLEGRERLADSDTKNSVDAVFNGSLLILESLSAESLLKCLPQPPSMVVKGVLTCQRHNSEANENNSRDKNVEENNIFLEREGRALRDSHQVPSKLNHPDGNVFSHRELNNSSSSSTAAAAAAAATSSSSSGSREMEPSRYTDTAFSPPVAKAVVAPPISWTVDSDSKKKSGTTTDSDLLKVNRRATVIQARDRHDFNEVSSGKEMDRITSDIRAPLSPTVQSLNPATMTATNRNRRDTVTNVVGAKAGEVRHDDLLSPRTQSENKKALMESSVLYHAECPLRCVCLFGDQIESNPRRTSQKVPQASSSSLVFAVGSNEKSVKVSRAASRPQGRPPSFEVISEFTDIHRGSVYAVDWRSSPEGPGLLATASNDKAIRIIRYEVSNTC